MMPAAAPAPASTVGPAPAALRAVEQVAEADAHVLVAGRRGVREVVGDAVDALLLGGHAGGGGVEPFEHQALPFGEATCVAVLCSVSSIVWIAFWPASKARKEAIMSTIVRAGSTPEPSSAPVRTVPVAGAGRRCR